MSTKAWPKISFFPLALAAAVIMGALGTNLFAPPYDTENSRVAQASLLMDKGRQAVAAENWAGARDYAGQAVSLVPSHITARLMLGLAFLNLNALDHAEAEFRQTLNIARDDRVSLGWAHNNLGVVYQRRGQAQLAIQEYETAVALDPSNQQARTNLAVMKRPPG